MNDELSPKDALQRAVDLAGSQTALAALLPKNVKQQHIHKWLSNGQCSPQYAIPIEQAVNEEVFRHQLRPDIYPNK